MSIAQGPGRLVGKETRLMCTTLSILAAVLLAFGAVGAGAAAVRSVDKSRTS